jgi:hypothetical protein
VIAVSVVAAMGAAPIVMGMVTDDAGRAPRPPLVGADDGNRAPELPPAAPIETASSSPSPVEAAGPHPDPAPTLEAHREPPRAKPPAQAPPAEPSASAAPAPPPATDEVSAVLAARIALREGQTARALALLDEHDRLFPRGAYGSEVELLRIEALSISGAKAEARTRAQRFLALHPDSPYARRAREHVGTEGGGDSPHPPSEAIGRVPENP